MTRPLMAEEEAALREHWDAAYLDVPFQELPWEAGEAPQELVALIADGKVKKGAALDICCGAGTSALYLTQQGFQVSGVDISPTALAIARERAAKAGLKIDYQEGNAINLPFPDESFDFVYDRGCFHHVPAPIRQTFIHGVHRVLKPGGKYQLFCFGWLERWATNHFSPTDIRRLFASLFHILSLEEAFHQEPGGARRHFLTVFMEKK